MPSKWATGGVLLVGIARVYLAVDHPTDAIFGAVLGSRSGSLRSAGSRRTTSP